MKTLLQIFESFRFAARALKSNLLRTVLSLLGVTVGIFAIITVLTLVDSLERNIKDSLNFLGAGVIYVDKRPFLADDDGVFKWWEYWRRPSPSYAEYRFLVENMKNHAGLCMYAARGGIQVKHENNSIGQVRLLGAERGYQNMFDLNVELGRFFSNDEIVSGRNLAVIGNEVAQVLFPGGQDPIGRIIKIRNMKFIVVGVIRKEGGSFLGTPSNDFTTIIPYQSFRKLFQTGTGAWNELPSRMVAKGADYDPGLIEMENELRGMLRVRRGLKPTQKDNFALNRPEALTNAVSGVFDTLSIAGWIIGGFSILVGGFGIANIMFVSVKERTSIIGLQKSLGARNYFILFQFLFESIFLSLIGGFAGLILVYLVTLIPMGDLIVTLSVENIALGLIVSSTIGLISGIVPAAMAARLNPVIAIRAS